LAFCTNCGAEQLEGAQFCQNCGAPLGPAAVGPGGAPAQPPAAAPTPATTAVPVPPPPPAQQPPAPPGMPPPPYGAAPPPPPAPRRSASAFTSPVAVAASIVGIVLMFIVAVGSALPWVTVSAFSFSVSAGGLHGDGWITLACALLALPFFAVGLLKRMAWPYIVALVLTLIICGVSIYDTVHVASGASVGYGLIIVVAAGVLGAIAAVVGIAAPRKP
jgi:hypothetical protein